MKDWVLKSMLVTQTALTVNKSDICYHFLWICVWILQMILAPFYKLMEWFSKVLGKQIIISLYTQIQNQFCWLSRTLYYGLSVTIEPGTGCLRKKFSLADYWYFTNGNTQQCNIFRHDKYNSCLAVCEVSTPYVKCN